MAKAKNYKLTAFCCFGSYIVQSITVNFVPLLFLTFEKSYGITLAQLSLLITMTFGVQLVGDLLAAKYLSHIGVRTGIVTANFLSAAGLAGLAFLPSLIPNTYAAIFAAVMLYSFGASLIEVLVSPIMEACPFEKKEAAMSLLHSFYCWGSVAVILLSTGFFLLFGLHNWKILALLWAVVPLMNGIFFIRVPLAKLPGDRDGQGMGLRKLVCSRRFLLLAGLMTAAGATELAVAQWASAFAEAGLHVTKAVGDLLGPMAFGVLMGLGRIYYAKNSERLNLRSFMMLGAACCAVSYLLIVFSPWPLLSLAGCALCGLGVATLWPGALSIGTKLLPYGGTAMFALMACAGDIGCTLGPTVVGMVSDAAGGNLSIGILAAIIFPAGSIALLLAIGRMEKSK